MGVADGKVGMRHGNFQILLSNKLHGAVFRYACKQKGNVRVTVILFVLNFQVMQYFIILLEKNRPPIQVPLILI